MLHRRLFAAALVLGVLPTSVASAATLPPGFRESVVLSGLVLPVAVRFSSDGRVFVAEKSGLIRVYPSLNATTFTVFADLGRNVHNYWDRGLLGLALDPDFPNTPYVYVLYALDAAIGGTPPKWGDTCPSPPGADTDGCVIGGRLSRLTAAGDKMTGSEEVLLEAWGQQFPSHSVGDLHFGPDGALYVSGGEGASFDNVDYGQYGIPINPLGDPPVPVGGQQTPPTAEGGALRSQSLRRVEGGPALTNGTILRVDKDGKPLPTNPLASSTDPIARRIIAYGLRNPFRFTIDSSNGEIWIGDVGQDTWEEINRIPNPTAGVLNFGWPCYEGPAKQTDFAAANLDLCNNLYAASGAVTSPFYAYNHSARVVSGEACGIGTSSVTGLAVYGGGRYPVAYNGALFFADYSRQCAWVMFPGSDGHPDPASRTTFIVGASTPVDLEIGPGGDLYYVDISGGKVWRVQYVAPAAVATASPTSGSAPLTVQFDGSASTPAAPGDTLTYAWDLNGDGNFDDSTDVKPSFVYTVAGTYSVRLKVTDSNGTSATSEPLVIGVANTAPTVVIDSPSPSLTWKVGDPISFSGHATDPQEGTLPASDLTWTVIIHHCPSNCHTHTIQTFTGVSSGSFPAPDHPYPSWLELQVLATDTGGLTGSASVTLNPQTTTITFHTVPTSLQLVSGTSTSTSPFVQRVIVGSDVAVNAPSPQVLGSTSYVFSSWSDGGAQTHDVIAPASAMTLTGRYTSSGGVPLVDVIEPTSGTASNATPLQASGQNFESGVTVTVGGVPASGVDVLSTTQIALVVPPLHPGTLNDVVATNPDGKSGVLPGAYFSDFADVSQSHIYHDVVERIFRAGITTGCGGGDYCPDVPVNRASMAAFVLRGEHGSSFTPSAATGTVFADVTTSTLLAKWIEAFSAEGITKGCGSGNYCPADSVSRAAMAAFLLRGRHGSDYKPPPATGTVFADVPAGAFLGDWIEELSREGITSGCGGTNFCPNQPVSRGEMAKFLAITFALP